MEQDYTVVVLGSGIAGSITALALQQLGIKTLVVERGSHPRFAIGESTLPTTTFLLRHFAERFRIPELAEICSYEGLNKHRCVAWPKQIFWFGVHREGEALPARHESINEALLAPLGPDVHMLRADVDAFLVSLFAKYGVDYVEHAEVSRFQADADGVTLDVRTGGKEARVNAQFVVDATGHGSALSKQLGLRDDEARLLTNTRSIFGHFRGVKDLDEALGERNPSMRFRRSAGTMHHCFPGGWFWVIPFDDGVTSVGLQLDRRTFPLDTSISAGQELDAFIRRFPDVARHLGDMTPIRTLVRTDRVQFTSRTILSERFIATPHAAAFVEPLFSTGIMLTLSFIDRFIPAALAAYTDKDWRIERFRFIDELLSAEIGQIDLLVDGTIQAFRDYDLFKQYWRAWVIGTIVQYGCCILSGGATRERPMLYGAGIDAFAGDLKSMHDLVCMTDADPAVLARSVQELIDPWWQKLVAPITWTIGDFSLGSPDSVNVVTEPLEMSGIRQFFATLIEAYRLSNPLRKGASLNAWIAVAMLDFQRHIATYGQANSASADFQKARERIFAQAHPDVFDYRRAVGQPA